MSGNTGTVREIILIQKRDSLNKESPREVPSGIEPLYMVLQTIA